MSKFSDLHVSLNSENEEEYLRQFADLIVERLVDDSRIGGRAIEEKFMKNSLNVIYIYN